MVTYADKSFKNKLSADGNFRDMLVGYKVMGETVHDQYIKKSKTIPIEQI